MVYKIAERSVLMSRINTESSEQTRDSEPSKNQTQEHQNIKNSWGLLEKI